MEFSSTSPLGSSISGDFVKLFDPSSIPLETIRASLPLWVALSGITVDNHAFTYHNHQYLWPLFADRRETIVLMKAAQMGATIYMGLKSLHQVKFPKAWGFSIPIKVGFYFPNSELTRLTVIDRFHPMMKGSPDLAHYHKYAQQTLCQVDDSSIYYLFMSGKSTKDSVPMNSVFVDEARLISVPDIEQTKKRLLASKPYRYLTICSTAGYPNADIHHWFLNSDQKWFTTICTHCKYEQILTLNFPNCIADHTFGPKQGQCYYICANPRCRLPIEDQQYGRYIAHGNPKHEVSGYQISQLISHNRTPKEILTEYKTSRNLKEFFNSVLGIPFVDGANKPVTLDVLEQQIYSHLEWGVYDESEPCYMGIDQMTNLHYVWVIQRLGEKFRVVWFEIIEDEDPFRRSAMLMEQFRVRYCLLDAMPNGDDARLFAKAHEKRVFLTYYPNKDMKEMVRWNDRYKVAQPFKKANPLTYYKYTVTLDRYLAIEHILTLLKERRFEFPEPERHLVKCYPYNNGPRQQYPILRTHAFPMLSCAVRERVVVQEETQKDRYQWNLVGMDPHALHALVYAVFASERRPARSFF